MSDQHPERSSWAVQNSLFLISRNSVRNLRKAIFDVVLRFFFCSDLMLKTSLVCKSSLFKINNLLFSYIKFYNVKTGVQLDTIPVQDCWNPADKHQSPALLCVRRTAHEFSEKVAVSASPEGSSWSTHLTYSTACSLHLWKSRPVTSSSGVQVNYLTFTH